MRIRMLAGATAATVLMFGLAGCDGLMVDGATSGQESVTIAVEPLVGSAAVYLGVQEGFFADEGIDLSINSLPADSKSVVSLVTSGTADFGLADTLTLLVEHSNDTPVKVVSGAYSSTGNPNSDFGALVVKADSPITSISEVQGKSVSSPAPRGLDETVVMGMIDDDGGNPAGVHFIKTAPSVTVAALESGEIDVAFLVEPYLGWALDSGHRVLSYPYADYVNYLNVALYFTSTDKAEDNPELTERFYSALKKSATFAQNNPDRVREVFATYTTTGEETRGSMIMPRFTPTIEVPALQKLGHTALEHGLLFAEPDLDSLLP